MAGHRKHEDLVQDAIRVLAGRPATDLHELHGLLCGSNPDLMAVGVRTGLCGLLRTLGYSERWVRERGGDEAYFMWVRAPWPADFGAGAARGVKIYEPA